MFRSLQDFQYVWLQEAEMTQNVMNALSDESLQQKVTPDGRSLGFLAWHIVQTLNEMMGQAGVVVAAPGADSPMPAHASEIATAFENGAKSVLESVLQTWTDEMLPEEITMYGMQWTRGQTLFAFVAHQAHHRGQMTVLMRQAGLTVPGTYGPAREEWAAMGMAAMQ